MGDSIGVCVSFWVVSPASTLWRHLSASPAVWPNTRADGRHAL